MTLVYLIRDSWGRIGKTDPVAICTTKQKALEMLEEIYEEERLIKSGEVSFNHELGYVYIDYKGECDNRSYDIEECFTDDWL